MTAFSELRGKFKQLETFIIVSHDLYDAGIGVDELVPEKVDHAVEARNVSVLAVSWDHENLLEWFRDGTETNPIARSQRP